MFNQPSYKYTLLVGDIITLVAAFLLAMNIADSDFESLLRYEPLFDVAVVAAILMMVPVFLFVYLLNDLYKLQSFRSRYRHVTIILKSLIVATLPFLLFAIIFVWDYFSIHGRGLTAYFLLFAFLLTTTVRLFTVRYLVHPLGRAGRKRRLLVVGGDSAAEKVVHALEQDPRSTYKIVGFIDDYKEKDALIFDNWKNLGRLDELDAVVAALSPDEILIAIDNAPYSRLVNVVNSAMGTGLVVRVFSDRLQLLAERVGAEQYAEDVAVIMLSQVEPGIFARALRRMIDVTLAFVFLIVFMPVLLAVVVGIKMSSPGPVFFRQTRIGFGGKPFDFYKFRSMHIGESAANHQEFVEKFIKGDIGDAADEHEIHVFKIKHDPRIFPFGKFIRRTSLDEFPQLFNVLKGDMGLVGPRPCLPYEWEAYDDWHKARLSVLPGCTGLWQVLGRSTVTFEDMVLMDLYYISNYSLVQDLRILYKTVPAIFFAKGGF